MASITQRMTRSDYYYFRNELAIRLRTSIPLWSYFCCVFITSFPALILVIWLHQPPSSQYTQYSMLGLLFLILMILFMPLNQDIFLREIQLNMLEFLLMKSLNFRRIFVKRLTANSLLMIGPILLMYSIIFLGSIRLSNYNLIFLIPCYILHLILLLYTWFTIAIIVQSVIEMKTRDSFIRTIFYYLVMFLALIVISGTTTFLDSNPIVPLSYDFANFPLEIVSLAPICFISHFILLRVIKSKYNRIQDQKHSVFTDSYGPTHQFNLNFYLLDKLDSFPGLKWGKTLIGILGSIFLVGLSLLYVEEMRNSLIPLYGLLITGICLYLLFWKFSRVTLDREYNMEELILSRISANQYLIRKIKFLLKDPLRWAIIPSILVILLTGEILMIMIMFIRIFYLVSIILLLWRLLPAKNLLGSSILTVLLIEIVGVMFGYYMLDAGGTLFLVSPILSPLLSVLLQEAQNTSIMMVILSLLISLIVSINFFLASLMLIKTQARYE